MSSKRKHAARSRKTYRSRQYAAARSLRGSLPFALLKMLNDMRHGLMPKTPEELADRIDDAVPPEEEVAA